MKLFFERMLAHLYNFQNILKERFLAKSLVVVPEQDDGWPAETSGTLGQLSNVYSVTFKTETETH